METTDFIQTVNRWSKALSDQIAIYRSAGKKVCIIAISRKMPRFIDWLSKSVSSDETKQLLDDLDSDDVTFTTEYAIPLIYAQNFDNPKSVVGIIIDDVMILGASLQNICMQWLALFGDEPKILSVFRSSRAAFSPMFESAFSLRMNRHNARQLEDDIHTISCKILSTSLPVDMEYPIIHIDRPYAELKSHIESSIPSDWIRYDVKSEMTGNESESFSVLLDDAKKEGYSNDFAKIRLFDKGDGCVLEVIAPNAVKVRSLHSLDLFSEDSDDSGAYSKAWSEVCGALRKVDSQYGNPADGKRPMAFMYKLYVRDAIASTSVIWAEYLYSLSAFIRNFDRFIPQDTIYGLRLEDVALILGNSMASDVYQTLTEILHTRQLFTFNLPQLAYEEYINPTELKDLYSRKIAAAIKPGVSVESNLDALFSVSHYTGDIFEMASKNNVTWRHCFGESYESLLHRLNIYHFGDKEILKKINRWIDQRIDESRIAPKYEVVHGSDKLHHYRRFFLSGSNKITID